MADESKALAFEVVNLLRFMTPVTMLAFAVIIVSEISGTEQAFQVEPLEQSALFRTMCTCCGCTNVAAPCPRLKSSQPGLGHPHHSERGPCGRDCHQPEVFQVSPQTCASRFLGSGESRSLDTSCPPNRSRGQFLLMTLKEAPMMRRVTSTATTIAKRRCVALRKSGDYPPLS